MRSENSDARLPDRKPNVPEEKLELGHTLTLCGWLCWIFMLLVLVFRSSEVRAGGTAMAKAAITLAVLGLGLHVVGRVMNRKR